MNQTENRFFEEFKRLDKLCSEMYGDMHGVTAYIEDMRAMEYANSCKADDFEETLRELVRLRHVRNALAHDTSLNNIDEVTENDIEWIINFYQKILATADPIALCSQKKQSFQSNEKVEKVQSRRKKKYKILLIDIGLIILLIILLVITYSMRRELF